MAATRTPPTPIAGRDYPSDWPQFLAFFPDEEACRRHLERLRWPGGFRCPACASKEAWRTKRGLWVCRACERQSSLTAGTLLAGTRTPLTSWFAAVWQLTNQKHGISALGLQRLLGLGSCPQGEMNDRTQRSPGFTLVTPGPTSSTVPAPSWPRTIGIGKGADPTMM